MICTGGKMRRTKFDIIVDIINLTMDGGANKTRIVYGANLNFKIANKYINFLLENGLIEEEVKEGKKYYLATEKGVQFLRLFRELSGEVIF
jgi:predicted transcriptional regulator